MGPLLMLALVAVSAVATAIGLAVFFAAPVPTRSHPHAEVGLDILRDRRPQDELEGWR